MMATSLTAAKTAGKRKGMMLYNIAKARFTSLKTLGTEEQLRPTPNRRVALKDDRIRQSVRMNYASRSAEEGCHMQLLWGDYDDY